jgi:hypothetical protein
VGAPANGFTIGFWGNPNGQNLLSANDPGWRTLLNGCNLRNANGTTYGVPTGTFKTAYTSFNTWLKNATAVNMAYMLSAQLAATTLDVQYERLSDNTGLIVPACLTNSSGANVIATLGLPLIPGPLGTPACAGRNCAPRNGYISIGMLRSLAIASLAANGNTTPKGAARNYQECLKNLLDMVNNNGNPPAPGNYNCGITQVISGAPAGCPYRSPY